MENTRQDAEKKKVTLYTRELWLCFGLEIRMVRVRVRVGVVLWVRDQDGVRRRV